ncbi:unnamed protein product [Orchesella dallaii]|uniref:Ferric-chelate reductase 1 n=1 Tax=Orchesella dallaii TaxID=48710 RepID=A0ABP1S0R0_9HEXA
MLLRLSVLLVLWQYVLHVPTNHHLVEGHPTIQCAQTGASFANEKNTRRSWDLRQGSFTIGARRFDSKYGGAMYSGFSTKDGTEHLFKLNPQSSQYYHCPYTYNKRTGWEIEFCDARDEKFKLRVQSVQQRKNGTGELITLHGWLHIEVELVDTADSFRMVYAQMYDEHFNAIGEFVKDPTEQCQSSNPAESVSPTEFQYLPCSAIGAREAKPSEALYMVHSDDLIDKSLKGSPFLPPKEMNRFIHFTWRMNEYWCSRHYRITPMIFLLTKKNIDNWRSVTNEGTRKDDTYKSLRKLGDWKMYRKIPRYWLLPDWIGAADIMDPSRGPLHCNKSVYNWGSRVPWIRGFRPHNVIDEYLHHSNLYKVYTDADGNSIVGSNTCQQNPYYIPNYSTFVGRCKEHKGKETSHNNLQKCNTDPNSPEFTGLKIRFDKYKEYVNNLTVVRKETCERPCRAPQTVEDAINISSLEAAFTKPPFELGYGLTHKSRQKASIARFYRGRKFHGVLCLIVTMFLMPVSNFVARYYKETYMSWQFTGIHVWFWAHVGGSIGSLGIVLTGQFAMAQTLDSWGRSKSPYAIFHHSLGWISVFLLILMVMYGGFRSSMLGRRRVQMIGHSIVGFVIYSFNILLILSSTYIPASPSLRQCDRDGLPTGFSVTLWMAMFWMGLDAVFHVFLTVLQTTADKTLGISRPLCCPILPILDPNSHEDMRRSGLRKLLFYLYLFLCTIFTLIATFQLALKREPDGCYIGEMSCKAALGCSKVGLAMCKKLRYKICTGGSSLTLL